MKTYEEVEAKLHEFLTSGLKEDTTASLKFFHLLII